MPGHKNRNKKDNERFILNEVVASSYFVPFVTNTKKKGKRKMLSDFLSTFSRTYGVF